MPPAREFPQRQRFLTPDEREATDAQRSARNAELARGRGVERDTPAETNLELNLQASRTVNPAIEADASRFRRQTETRELPLYNQRALAVYGSNQQFSSAERTTSELVGVDLFV